MNYSSIVIEYLETQCSAGSRHKCNFHKSVKRAAAEADVFGLNTWTQFLDHFRGEEFCNGDANNAKALTNWAMAQDYLPGYEFKLAHFHAAMATPIEKNYRFNIEDIKREVSTLDDAAARCAGSLACLGFGPALLSEVTGFDGQFIRLAGGKPALQLTDAEVGFINRVGLFHEDGPFEAMRTYVGDSGDRTLDSDSLIQHWKTGRGELPYTLKQIAMCWRVSYLMHHGITGIPDVVIRQCLKSNTVHGQLCEWATKNYITWDMYNKCTSTVVDEFSF